MTTIQWMAIAGGACGSLGSVLTAYSVSDSIKELNFARQTLYDTVQDIIDGGDIIMATGHDERFDRAVKRDRRILRIGVFLLVAGFILQAASTFLAPANP